jgi:hypothetical protein
MHVHTNVPCHFLYQQLKHVTHDTEYGLAHVRVRTSTCMAATVKSDSRHCVGSKLGGNANTSIYSDVSDVSFAMGTTGTLTIYGTSIYMTEDEYNRERSGSRMSTYSASESAYKSHHTHRPVMDEFNKRVYSGTLLLCLPTCCPCPLCLYSSERSCAALSYDLIYWSNCVCVCVCVCACLNVQNPCNCSTHPRSNAGN